MNITPKTKIKSAASILGVSLLILFLLLGYDRRSSEPAKAGTIRISSPEQDTVAIAGQTLLVTIEPSAGISLREASAEVFPASLEIPQIDDSPPFQILVRIPEDRLGPAIVKAAALDQDGNRLETSIRIIIRSPEPPLTIQVQPEEILFFRAGESTHIDVSGSFADGIRRDITRSPETLYISGNPRVASVSSAGRVLAVAPGATTINVTHRDLLKLIEVSVGTFELQGDLDGDNDIDRDDLAIILGGQNTSTSGPGDPRDLNNDGLIDALDAGILVDLCSRPQCGTGVIKVEIDIKPGSFPNSINLGTEGVVAVAILSRLDFDAPAQVDRASVTLAGAPVSERGLSLTAEDVDGDGELDLVLHFNSAALQLDSTDTEAVLKGKTVDGHQILGADAVSMVPAQR